MSAVSYEKRSNFCLNFGPLSHLACDVSGIYGIYVSCQAKSARENNDIETAKLRSSTANTVWKLAVGIGICLIILNGVLQYFINIKKGFP